MEYKRNLTRYFRQCLIDADRASPNDKDILPLLGSGKEAKHGIPYVALGHQAWIRGQVPPDQAGAIFVRLQRQS